MSRSSSASQIQYQQHPNAPFPEAEKKASGLQTPPSYVNGICLSDTDFRDALHLRNVSASKED